MKEIGVNIEIQEIKGGFTVKFFSANGSTALDYTAFFKTWLEVMAALKEWMEKQEAELWEP